MSRATMSGPEPGAALTITLTGRSGQVCAEVGPNPHGNGKIPAGAAVPAYPVTERQGVVWLWPGDAARADESLICSCSRARACPSRCI